MVIKIDNLAIGTVMIILHHVLQEEHKLKALQELQLEE